MRLELSKNKIKTLMRLAHVGQSHESYEYEKKFPLRKKPYDKLVEIQKIIDSFEVVQFKGFDKPFENHIIKLEYDDGVKLDKPEYWCGRKSLSTDWQFQDAQHAALSSKGGITQCKSCLKAIIKALSEQL